VNIEMSKPFLMFSMLSVAVFACAQQTGSSDVPVIRTASRLVEVGVTVYDKHGPVTGLTKDDFSILDRGKPQIISTFSAGAVSSPSSQEPSLPANTFSNRQTVAGTTPPTITVILLDGLNTRFEDQNRAKRHLIRALGDLTVGSQDRAAVYALGSSLKILADFTEPARLQKILAGYRGRLNTEMDTSEPMAWDVGDPLIDQAMDFINQAFAQAENADRAAITFSALAAIANHAATIPGRKNLIWVTGSLPLSAAALAKALNAADISVYPVDARGLIGLPASFTAAAPASRRPRAFQQPSSLSPSGLDAFRDLAEQTGGRAWINGNDLHQAFRSALDDSAGGYTLGFQPGQAGSDGKYHELRVALRTEAKHPGLELRYRKGYLAARDAPSSESEDAKRLQTALWSPLESSALGLRATLATPDTGHPEMLKISCSLDTHQIDLEQSGGHWKGALDILIVQQDTTSKVLDLMSASLDLRFTQAEYQAHLKAGVVFYRDVAIKPGLATLRILVLDRGSGMLGSLIVPASRVALVGIN
jgi:VWFA-related protein